TRAMPRRARGGPPYHVDGSAPRLPHDFGMQLDGLVRSGKRADAVELFMVKAAEASPRDVAAMRGQPFWPAMEAAAQTLAYEAFVMGPDNQLPAGLLAGSPQPTPGPNRRPSPPGAGASARAVVACT